jgi:hypothetical protein
MLVAAEVGAELRRLRRRCVDLRRGRLEAALAADGLVGGDVALRERELATLRDQLAAGADDLEPVRAKALAGLPGPKTAVFWLLSALRTYTKPP